MTRREEEAIVLSVDKSRSADRVVSLIGETGELLRAYAPAAAKSKRRFAGALLPGAVVRASWTVRREGSMPVLDELQLLHEPPSPEPLERFYVVCHLLELAVAFAREGDENPRTYRLLQAVLRRIARGDPASPLARYFEAWTLRLSGLLPEFDRCAVCGEPLERSSVAVSPERGASCAEHAGPGSVTLTPSAASWIDSTRVRSPSRMERLSRADDARVARLCHRLIVSFTERPMRSWPALAAMLEGASERAEDAG